MFNRVKYSSLNELIYDEIKSKILTNELKPNEKLDIDYLSTSLGVSRTPVTNALKSLQKDGYVVINPRSGSYVRELTKEELEYIFDFREVLEAQVIRKAITKLDILSVSSVEGEEQVLDVVEKFFEIEINFHEHLIDACPSIIGAEIMNLVDLTKRIRKLHIIYKLHKAGWECFKEEIEIHVRLIETLINEELEESIRWISTDIHHTKEEIMDCFDIINQW